MTTKYDVDKLNRYYEGRNKRGLAVPDDGDILNSEVQRMSISQLQDFVEEFGFRPAWRSTSCALWLWGFVTATATAWTPHGITPWN